MIFQLFDFIVLCIANFTKEHLPNQKEVLPLGFTFSFGTSQQALDSGILINWAISIDCPNGIGKDIVQLLKDAIKRHGNLNIDVVAILNDTTGTLVNGIYLDKECVIGVVIGSGTNIAYIEKVENIEKLDKNLRNKLDKIIINTECGTFGDDGSIDFAKTKFDKKTDEGSLYPNSLA